MGAGPPPRGRAPQWGAPQHGGPQPPPGAPRTGGPLGGILALLAGLLAVAFMIEIRNRLADVPLVHALLTSSTGAGLSVILAGGVLGIGSAFLPVRRRAPAS